MATGKKLLQQESKIEIGNEVAFYVEKVQSNGLVVRRNAEKSYFISEKGLDLSKTFEVNSTIIATVKKLIDNKVLVIK